MYEGRSALALGTGRAAPFSLCGVCTETLLTLPLVPSSFAPQAPNAKGSCGAHLTLCAQESGVPVLCNSRVSEVAGQGVWRTAAGGGGDLWRGGAGPGADAGALGFSNVQIAAILPVVSMPDVEDTLVRVAR